MKVKVILGAVAVMSAVALSLPAFAADKGTMKPIHHMHQRHRTVHKPMHKPMHPAMRKRRHHPTHPAMRHRHMQGAEARARAETAKLNREQLQYNGIQPK